METNNVEMTPEVVEVNSTGMTYGKVVAIAVAVDLIVEHAVIPAIKWAGSKFKGLRKPKLQAVEDEE